jgi:hypothetical protein
MCGLTPTIRGPSCHVSKASPLTESRRTVQQSQRAALAAVELLVWCGVRRRSAAQPSMYQRKRRAARGLGEIQFGGSDANSRPSSVRLFPDFPLLPSRKGDVDLGALSRDGDPHALL